MVNTQKNYTASVEQFVRSLQGCYGNCSGSGEMIVTALLVSELNTGNDDRETCRQIVVMFQQ